MRNFRQAASEVSESGSPPPVATSLKARRAAIVLGCTRLLGPRWGRVTLRPKLFADGTITFLITSSTTAATWTGLASEEESIREYVPPRTLRSDTRFKQSRRRGPPPGPPTKQSTLFLW